MTPLTTQARLAVLLLAVAASACTPAAPPAARKPVSSPAPSAPVQGPSPGPTALPSGRPATILSEVAFANPSQGWAVGFRCDSPDGPSPCAVLASMTRDGGRTWSSPALVGQPAYSLDSSPRLHVRFAGADGWAFGPGIYGSHDSGRTWHLQDERPILALEATANSAWAVVGCIRAHPCVPHLVVSSPGSDTWTDAPAQPGAAAAGDAMLERPTARTAFLVTLANDSKAYSGGSQLFVTRDGGHTWNGSPSPCDEIRQVRSLDGSLVWILCASQPGAGSQPKAVYVSRDGGRTWDLRAQSAFPSPVGDIGLGGYAASLVVTSPTTGLIGLLRGSVRVSSDQGRTWHPPVGDVLGGDAGAGVEELWFVDRNHGWALGGVGLAGPPLWMTSDGGYHWGPAGRPLDTSNLS